MNNSGVQLNQRTGVGEFISKALASDSEHQSSQLSIKGSSS